MTDGVAVPPGKQTFLNPTTGALLNAGKVYHYIPGTDTPKDTWQDEGLTVLNTNPITLDGAGQCTIWGDGLYRQVLEDSAGNQIWDKVTGFAASASSIPFATPAEVLAGTDPTKVVSPYNLKASGTLERQYPNFQLDYGGNPDGVVGNPGAGTDNAALFSTAAASSFSHIWLNDGTFRSTALGGVYQKYFDGPGKIYNSAAGETYPGRFTYLNTPPTQYPTQGVLGWFAGDTSYTQPEFFVIGVDCRRSVTDRYFEATTIPHNRWFTSFSGSSGNVAHVVSGATVGSGSIVLDSVDGLTVGDEIGFSATPGTLTLSDPVTILTINGGTNTITFTPVLTNAYSAGAYVGLAPRLNNPFNYLQARNYGAGDFYGDVWRMQQRYVPLAGQTHFFETSTVGQAGGDINFFQSGTYGTGWESQYIDNGFDIAAIAQVDSFIRDNDTGARSVVWMGTFFKSEGSKPADVAHAVAGKWRIALDTVKADLSTFVTPGDNLNCAINTKLGDRWIMNSTASTAGRGGSTVYGTFFGNVPGDMYVESGTDGSGDYIAMRFNRAPGSDGRLRLRPASLNTNVQFNCAADISAALGVYAGAGHVLGIGNVGSGEYISVNTGSGKWEFYIGGVLVGTVP